MPKFKFQFERTYTITEGFARTIEAPSHAEAAAAASNLAASFNQDCPDDCAEIESGFFETGDFEEDNFRSEGPIVVTGEPDYVVGPDGQIFDNEGTDLEIGNG